MLNEKEALEVCLKLAEKNRTPVKPVRAIEQKEGLTFFFLAPEKTDFRNLARDLNRHFKMRIDLQHLAGRRAAAFLPGCGRCGRPLCCRTWLKKPPRVSPETVQNQLKPNGPADDLTGACGKLLCCLTYETRDRSSPEAAPPAPEAASEEGTAKETEEKRSKKKTKGRRLVRRLTKARKPKAKGRK